MISYKDYALIVLVTFVCYVVGLLSYRNGYEKGRVLGQVVGVVQGLQHHFPQKDETVDKS